MEKLFAEMNGVHPMPKELEKFIKDRVLIRTFRKGEVISKAGHICRYVYFIEKGLIRHVAVREGKTYTPWILKEGDIVTSVKSFFYQAPATGSIVAIEETEMIFLSFDDLEEGCLIYPELAIVKEKVKDKYYARKEDRDHQLGLLETEERYQFILETDPELTTRVQ